MTVRRFMIQAYRTLLINLWIQNSNKMLKLGFLDGQQRLHTPYFIEYNVHTSIVRT
jgi:hypothetical protein